MRVLGLIPARGGSKGIHRKNVRLLGGKPLLQYTAEVAIAAKRLDRLILSTDDESCARVGETCGLEIPFRRPPELAQHDTPMLPVVQHALDALETAGDRFDAVCLLQPTHPFRLPEDIDGCIALLDESGCDSVVTILPVPAAYSPHWSYYREEGGQLKLCTGERNPIARRQDLPPTFHREGSVYVTRRDVLVEGNSLYGDRMMGYLVDDSHTRIDLDDLEDWAMAERLVAQGRSH